MRVTWFVIFLQIECEKKRFLIETEDEAMRNSSKSQSQGKAMPKIDTVKDKSKNKSKNLNIVKRTNLKGNDYWSNEEYEDDPYYNEYDEYHYYGNDQNFDNSYGNDQHFDNSYGNDQHFDNSYGNDQHFDDFYRDEVGRGRCGGNSRRGRNHQYELRLNEALHIECGHGGCIGSVKISSCRTRKKFERSSHSERACIGKESCCLKARDHLRRPGFHCNRRGNREKVKIKYRCDKVNGKGFDLTEVVRAGHPTCNQRLFQQVQSTTTTTPTTTPVTTTPSTTRRVIVRTTRWTTRRYTRRWTPKPKPTVRKCVWIICWG